MKKGLWIIGVGILFAASCNHSPKTEQSSELANSDTLKADSSLATSPPPGKRRKFLIERRRLPPARRSWNNSTKDWITTDLIIIM